MKKAILILFLGIVFIFGCSQENDVTDIPVLDSENSDIPVQECSTSSDCVVGGCSGTICQNKNAEPVITTCEYKDEYACYESIDCGCTAGKCQWQKTAEFERCVAEEQ